MANDNTKMQYIIELLTQGDAKKATDELGKLAKASEGAGKGMDTAKDSARQLFALLGGTAVIKQSLDSFIEAERIVNGLAAALELTKNNAPGVKEEILALADALGDDLKVQADDVVKVMTQLVSFGANPRDLKRLTEAVYDLSEVMGRDVGRAARGMSQALRGNFEVFQQLGIEVDKTKFATDGFNEAFETMTAMINGRARKAVQGVAGDVQGLKVSLEDAKQELGRWSAAVLTAAANVGANLGSLWDRATVESAVLRQKDAYIALADAIAKAILEAEKLGKITKAEAGQMFGRLGGAREVLFGGLTSMGQTTSDEELRAIQEQRLPQAGGLLRGLQEKLNLPRTKETSGAPAGSPEITSPELSQKDAEAGLEMRIALEDELLKRMEDEQRLAVATADLQARQSLEALDSYRASEAMKQELAMQTVLTSLDGQARVSAQIEFDHIKRTDQIREMKFETEEQYAEVMAAEQQLYDAQARRFKEAQTYSFQLTQDMRQIAESGAQAFSSGLATAIVSAFEEGDKAFQKFASSFLRQIAEMILQALILRAIKSSFGGYFGEGGQATAMAGGGVIYAADGVQSVNSATYFPRFNVVAGEAGREVMTVLARPRFERINGVPAQVGYAGNNRLAITSADALANSGGGGMRGQAVVRVELAPGLVASIKDDSIQGARVAIVQDMSEDSQLSRVTRQKVS